ncbi:hypothetical protein Gorai_007082 [Gossypium raimondii]|uniref:Chaperone DnaJ C-terminal domain-containing protein n=1 Tax=Gossypium raimondii TaxID=29730 RepID=A0A7J8Q7M5_GOSRA|nr:hypothetical protein [Gossypium raimondii]
MSCQGSGVVEGVKEIKVTIPAGVDSGDTIRVPEAGNIRRQGSQLGNLFIKIKVADDPVFTRDGADVYVDSNISFTQAILGGAVEVPTLSGKIQVKIIGHEPQSYPNLDMLKYETWNELLMFIKIHPKRMSTWTTSCSKRQRHVLIIPPYCHSRSLFLGLPKHGFLAYHGDQYVRFRVNLPIEINNRQRAILEELAEEEINNENESTDEGNW